MKNVRALEVRHDTIPRDGHREVFVQQIAKTFVRRSSGAGDAEIVNLAEDVYQTSSDKTVIQAGCVRCCREVEVVD